MFTNNAPSKNPLLTLNGKNIKLLSVKGHLSKCVGLLNHQSLQQDEGLLFTKTFFLHSFGMSFDFAVAELDKFGKQLGEVTFFPKNSIYISSRKAKYLAEIKSEHAQNFHSKSVIQGAKAKSLYLLFRFVPVLVILLLCFYSLATLAANPIQIRAGGTYVLQMKEKPKSVEIMDPQVIDAEEAGFGNKIKLTARNNGTTDLYVKYAGGETIHYLVKVGTPTKAEPSMDLGSNLPPLRLAAELSKIDGIKAVIENQKIVIYGKISNISTFREIAKIAASKPDLFTPAYSYSKAIEIEVVRSVQDDLRSLNEPALKLKLQNDVTFVTGHASSVEGKKRALKYLSAVLPGVVDATERKEGQSALVQVNLHFLEVSKGGDNQFGFSQPGMSKAIGATLSFAKGGFSQPNFQVAPLEVLLNAVKNRSFSRELANPVLITRAGEKASFLAGGEVPLVIISEKEKRTEFKPFGISFSVIPDVQSDGSIWLQVDFEVSSVVGGLAQVNNPAFLTRKINTNIILQEGASAMLSGLTKSADAKSVEKMPGIADIPILGELFKSRKFKDEETELWVVVTALKNGGRTAAPNLKSKYEQLITDSKGHLLD